ncbi:ribosome biogenesis protein SLX9-domain-containing protein [Syncephalis pseudoplumigaleata]|uniref:Ribosome biogenesis protein SLX9 n=1 Tax=Syncephalis pseudoplumigaleata TaxID=1712513 RepID=A0A4P9Z7S5_9FUNG|nr:ribosome biogenesis protein SLX9-domain-containing protein [Syncephalis pseudoplumigaleata]|eukprot:RKP27971.1 ribosome biogenesis protein SLX9-domain-containing protein [Syncephalis pseudoplumigaleata]
MPKVVNKRSRVRAAAVHVSKRAFAHGSAVERIVPQDTADTKEIHVPATATTVPGMVPLSTEASKDDGSMPRQTTKREKREQRRQRLLARLESTHHERSKSRKTKSANQTGKASEAAASNQLLADWTELSRAVQGMDMALQSKEKQGEPAKPPSTRRREKIAKNERTRFQAVLEHPAFKSNPLAAIRQHVVNTFGTPATMTGSSSMTE